MIHVYPSRSRLAFAALISLLCALSGCGHPPPASLATNAMASPVMELDDATSSPKRFRALFVAGSVPDDKQRKELAKLEFVVTQVSPVSDSQATVHVLVDDEHGQRIGEADWTVVQDGGKWKLKAVPLP